MKSVIVLLTALAVLSCGPPVFAGSVRFSWDHNEPRPDGYRVFVRYKDAPYDYGAPVWEGAENMTDAIPVQGNVVFHGVVRAFIGELESADSEEVSHAIISAPGNFGITIIR